MEGKMKGKKRRDGPVMQKDMDDILSDPRFAHVTSDLRLRHMPKEKRKFKLDSRFHSVLTDDKFYEKSTMDPRGKKGNYSTKEDLLKFYQLSSEEESDDEEDGESVYCEGKDENNQECIDESEEEDQNDLNKDSESSDKDTKVYNNKEGEDMSKLVQERVGDMNQDYARGETLFSDDSSDDDSSTDNSDDDAGEFEWGELDQDAVWDDKEEVEETSRLAVCNLDWDRIKAADIMMLLASFCPRAGSVKRVIIFPSEYGKQRLAEEDLQGPQELRKSKMDGDNDNLDLVDLDRLEKGVLDQMTGTTKRDFEALRWYQRNRLRYYYAVVECDSTSTAKAIYTECDRTPYQGAGFLLDLRYIPSDMTFDETPHDMCQKVPEIYEVKNFTTTALHDSRPVLTWDETDPERQKTLSSAMTQAMKGGKLKEDCLKGLIASSSDEEDADIPSTDDGTESDSDNDTKASRIAKFRALISEIDEKERKKKEREIDMEETFNLEGDKKEVESDEEEEEEKDSDREDKLTTQINPFDKYLEKRKMKRKERIQRKKKEKKKVGKNVESDDSDEEGQMSDDELPEDASDLHNDPFFAKELKKMKKKKPKKGKGETNDPNGVKTADQDNLELLLMDQDAEERKHFSMREIIETNKDKKKRRKNKLKKKKEENIKKHQQKSIDDFKVNISDSRFSGLMTSGEYNIDPSHSQFKRTKAMDTLIQEVQRKRVAESFEKIPDIKRSRPEERNTIELSALVNKVKNKTKKPNIK